MKGFGLILLTLGALFALVIDLLYLISLFSPIGAISWYICRSCQTQADYSLKSSAIGFALLLVLSTIIAMKAYGKNKIQQ